jgi:hypothetical protein
MRWILIILIIITGNITNIYAENNSRKFEEIDIPATAFNTPSDTPTVYKLQYKHSANFLINVKNELTYNLEYEQAKAAIRFGDNERDKLFELIMYDHSKRLSILLLTDKETGYVKYYEGDNSWFNDKIFGISFMENDKLSIHNGQRNIMDRFKIGEFTLDTIEVYSKDSSIEPANIIGGKLSIEIFSGNPLDNPTSFIPIIASAVIGIIVVILLKVKRR